METVIINVICDFDDLPYNINPTKLNIIKLWVINSIVAVIVINLSFLEYSFFSGLHLSEDSIIISKTKGGVKVRILDLENVNFKLNFYNWYNSFDGWCMKLTRFLDLYLM